MSKTIIVYSDCYTHIVSKAIDNLQVKIDELEKQGYKVVGPAQVVKQEHNDLFAFVTMTKDTE